MNLTVQSQETEYKVARPPHQQPLKPRRAHLFKLIALLILTAGLALTGCSKAEGKTELIMGAASSLTEPLNELSELYASRTGIRPQISYASSGTLRKQVEEGAPFDLLLLASASDLQVLADAGLLLDDTSRNLLSNQICFVSKASAAPATLEMLSGLLESAERVTLGDPSSAPVGRYAMESLETLGLATLIEDKLLYAKDARQVLQYLNTGAVDAGFIFATDVALLESELSVLALPEHTHKSILYPAAVLADSQHQAEAQAFLDFLSTDDAVSVFESHGFSIPRQQ
jgi:molybdate transport system substrate-binding protein